MKLWPKRPRHEPQPSEEALDALWRARRDLLNAERLDSAAADVAEALRRTRERNHFAAAVRRAIRGV